MNVLVPTFLLTLGIACLPWPAYSLQSVNPSAQRAEIVARYPLITDLNDASGANPPMSANHAPFLEGKGLFCNGQYVRAVATACDVRTPDLKTLDFSGFTLSAQFFVPLGRPAGGPIIVGGQLWRWLFYELGPGGRVALGVNSTQRTDCSVRYRFGVWHEATITFDGRTVTLYLDGVAGCQANVSLNTGNERFLLLTNFANGSTFYGVVRELTVYNGVRVPAPRTPVADAITVPAPADLTPADQFLAKCPTREQIASIDRDFRLSFEMDPTRDQPLACTERAGSRDLSPMKKRVYNVLLLAQRLEFDQPLPWTKQPLYKWLTEAIRGARFRGDIELSSCCSPGRLINIASRHLVIGYTDRWMEPGMQGGLFGFLLLLAHEARHADGHSHTCGTKDQTPEEMGAWGVQYSLMRWLAEHTDRSFFSNDVIRASEWMLRQAAITRKSAFCQQQ